ncbi:MAG: hypothetical protein FJ267_16095 [Planctomycetes bacterium]|nr:hypothetical protein [Planctomycetota bacterium]
MLDNKKHQSILAVRWMFDLKRDSHNDSPHLPVENHRSFLFVDGRSKISRLEGYMPSSFPRTNSLISNSTPRDVHLMDQALAEIQTLPYPNLRDITCQVRNDELILYGQVESFFQKQFVQERLRLCLGNEVAIKNELRVGEPFPVSKRAEI